MSTHQLKELSPAEKKRFRTIGHQLKPIVTIGDKGLSENLEKELNRALEDHELIKVKLPAGDKTFKTELIHSICTLTGSIEVQQVGKIVLLFRSAKKPKANLSNLLRFANQTS